MSSYKIGRIVRYGGPDRKELRKGSLGRILDSIGPNHTNGDLYRVFVYWTNNNFKEWIEGYRLVVVHDDYYLDFLDKIKERIKC